MTRSPDLPMLSCFLRIRRRYEWNFLRCRLFASGYHADPLQGRFNHDHADQKDQEAANGSIQPGVDNLALESGSRWFRSQLARLGQQSDYGIWIEDLVP